VNEYQRIRLEKLEEWKKRQIAYPGKFTKTHTASQIKELPDQTSGVKLAGRLLSMRVMGKLTFAQVQDHTGKVQISLQQDILGAEDYKFFTKKFDIGDYIGLEGETYTTQKQEKTLQAKSCILLAKGIRPLPEKFHGLSDPELKARYRYLDLIMSEETQKKFKIRNEVIKFIRNYLDKNNFLEVDTPILQTIPCGASARPFITHHNALDIPLYLRIAPETYLKRLIAGGYEKVYELGKSFRNEGIDASHLQEFTILEYYCAYWDYQDNMVFIKNLLQDLVKKVLGTSEIEYEGTKLNFAGEWPVMSYRDLVLKYTKIDLHEVKTLDDLKKAVKAKNLDMPLDKYVGLGSLIDGIYKKYCRPHLVQPIFITKHHTDLVPLARTSDENSSELDMFQVVVNGWEIVKAYSELVDPIEQRKRLEDQAKLQEAGDDEAMWMEEDFILAMEYGMPPMSGLGLGIERLIALLTNSSNIRDIIYFPSLRPPQVTEELE
jgi:lysyl-tRNA synthetase class 2